MRERCSCGAEFETDEENAVSLLYAWRKRHKCVAPVDLSPTSGMALIEQAPDATVPELHIGFRADPFDE